MVIIFLITSDFGHRVKVLASSINYKSYFKNRLREMVRNEKQTQAVIGSAAVSPIAQHYIFTVMLLENINSLHLLNVGGKDVFSFFI